MEPETIKGFELSGSVGAGGKNDKYDIMTVQLMLNSITPEQGGAVPRLQEDGAKVGPNWSRTVEAIRIFQDEQFGWNDGRVDPEKATHRRMREIMLGHRQFNRALTITEIRPADGMDETVEPKWQMVPEGGFKRVHVKGLAETPGAQVRTLDAKVATVAGISGDVVLLRGQRVGSTKLQVFPAPGSPPSDELDLGVRRHREVPLYFHYVRNNLGKGTKYRSGSSAEILMGLNGIYQPQANVKFVLRGERETSRINGKDVKFDQKYFCLDDSVGVPKSYQVFRWTDLVAESPGRPLVCSVFFVKEFEDDNSPRTKLSGQAFDIGQGPVVVEDRPGLNRFQTLGHEIAHVLGCVHDSDRDSLVCDGNGAAENGTRIRKAHMDIMNPE